MDFVSPLFFHAGHQGGLSTVQEDVRGHHINGNDHSCHQFSEDGGTMNEGIYTLHTYTHSC